MSRCALLASLAIAASPLLAQQAALFDRVAEVLSDDFYDRRFRDERLPALIDRYRPAAAAAGNAAEERAVIHAFLGEIPASHLALYSAATHRRVENELFGKAGPTFGCVLTQIGGRYYVDGVFENGPALAAGLRRGDRVLAIDGVPPSRSRRLDWRADDAFLPDPAVHYLLGNVGDTIVLRVASSPGDEREVTVTATRSSALAASQASCQRLQVGEHLFGYVHLWFVFHGKSASLLRSAAKRFADTEGLVIDLRGRGGSGNEVEAIVDVLEDLRRDGVPMVFLVDGRTRSAKEVMAYEIHQRGLGPLVGERTAGAVIPATFTDVGGGGVLMFPSFTLGDYTREIEGKGVAPDHQVADPLPFAAGDDPILVAGAAVLAEVLTARR